MDTHPDVNGVCGRYEYPDGAFQRFYSQLPTEFDMIVTWGVGRHITPLLFHRRSREYYLVDRDFTQPMTIEQPAFSCVLMRGDAVRQVGALDERFPIFFNDIDYCWRWREHGLTWHYLPDWRIVHDKSSRPRASCRCCAPNWRAARCDSRRNTFPGQAGGGSVWRSCSRPPGASSGTAIFPCSQHLARELFWRGRAFSHRGDLAHPHGRISAAARRRQRLHAAAGMRSRRGGRSRRRLGAAL